MLGRFGLKNLDLVDLMQRRPAFCFVWISVVHLLLWVIIPIITQPNAPLDTLEMIYWGHEWELGYYKHPPLPGWLAEIVCIGQNDVWPTYVLAQVATLTCFWCAFALGRKTLGNVQSILSVLLLQGCYYYNFTTVEFNNNVSSRAFWALAILFLYSGLTKGKTLAWIGTGVCLGLGMLCKYDTAILAVIMVAFSAIHPVGRRCWKTTGPLACLTAALLVFGPHLYWLVQHDFPTVAYFFRRSESSHSVSTHFTSPFNFAMAQLLAISPIGLLAVPVLGWRWSLRQRENDERLNRDFLLWFCFGPFLLVVAAGMLLGVHIRSMWGTAMWSYITVATLFFVRSQVDGSSARRVIVRSASFCILALVIFGLRNTVLPEFRGKASRIHFPGRELASLAQEFYEREVGGSPEVVAGPWWEAANVAFYGKNRASVYADIDPEISPWISDERFMQTGGVLIWERNAGNIELERSLKSRFTGLRLAAPFKLRWQTSADLEPIEFAMAVLPPNSMRNSDHAESSSSVLQARKFDSGDQDL